MRRCGIWCCLLALAPTAGWGADVFYETDVRPIFKAHCFRCHGQEGQPEGGLDLRLVRTQLRGGDSGPALSPGAPTQSLLLQKIRAKEMPPEGAQPLTDAQVQQIERWIAAGAPTRRPEPETPSTAEFTEEDRDFWSFRPLARAAAPLAAGELSPLDAFVAERRRAQQLSGSPPADRRTLLRRAAFALTGLPPTTAAITAFEGDADPLAYVRRVDEYLASPQFGERWARFWLDLARYVDQTPDYLTSADRAWIYRDWVIRAWNEDRPYDDFVRQQLAADLLENPVPADYAALGFLGLSPTYWKELRLSPDVIKTVVAEEWDERIDVITRTFLGLTVSCARCHDHKFDPVTMRDYYALAGVVASTQLAERPLLPPEQATAVRQARQRLAALQQDLDLTRRARPTAAEAVSAEYERLQRTTPLLDEPWAHVVEDASVYVLPDGDEKTRLEFHSGEARNLPLFRRGNPSDEGETLPRRFLAVLARQEAQPFQRGSGRAELAESLLTESQGLAARVIVNRIWAQLFGQGLVRTTSDFGRQGEPPTHPELLDYLAGELVRHGWSLKWLIREIVLSETFQQSSQPRADGLAIDPENRLLWRMHRRRLDVEPFRDALLVAAGWFDDRLYGPATPLENVGHHRRTLYGKVVREEQNVVLRLYDFPEPSAHSPGRDQTTTPLQQLFVLNSPHFQHQAEGLARSILQGTSNLSMPERIAAGYRQALGRAPRPREVELGERYLRAALEAGQTEAAAWQNYAHVLLSLNEFLYVD